MTSFACHENNQRDMIRIAPLDSRVWRMQLPNSFSKDLSWFVKKQSAQFNLGS